MDMPPRFSFSCPNFNHSYLIVLDVGMRQKFATQCKIDAVRVASIVYSAFRSQFNTNLCFCSKEPGTD